MRTPAGWIIVVVSILCICLNAFMVWWLLTQPYVDARAVCGDHPNCAAYSSGRPGYLIFGAAVSGVLAALGTAGIVEFARRGSARWSTVSVISTTACWALVFSIPLIYGPGF